MLQVIIEFKSHFGVNNMAVDPIAMTLVQKRLDHLTRHMGWAMTRTAQSPIFSESNDFSCFLSNDEGDALSVADGLPIHVGGGDFAVRAVLRDYGTDLHDGDVFLLSDPYAAGGNHLPDWTVIRPIIVEGTLLGFANNRAHQSDIGGGVAGTYNPEATEIYQEGIRLPVLRLYERGRIREDLWRLLLLNSRTPDLLDGDLAAMAGSTRTARDGVAVIVKEYGVAETKAVFRAILDHAQVIMREMIGSIPAGVYHGEDISDNDCFDSIEVPVRVTLTVKDGSFHFDFTGTAPQIRGFKNSPLANTSSAVFLAVMAFFNGRVPANQGALRQISINAPLGSVVNPQPPAPVTACTVHPTTEIAHAVWRALAQAVPSDAYAGWGKMCYCMTTGQKDDGKTFVMYHWNGASGAGAVQGRDGFPTAGQLCALGGARLPNIEVYEQVYPVSVHCYEMRLDSGGAGEFRGGTGIDYSVTLHDAAQYSLRGEGTRNPSGYGAADGEFGARGSLDIISLETGQSIGSLPQYGLVNSGPARVDIRGAGGGGFGNPLHRDPLVVRRDVLDELVSEAAARETYGVVLIGASCELDLPATDGLRRERLRMRSTAA
ncbi:MULTISPECIES: hydantoinase B/oxoprolinase family protein [unclassified Mesorhizobium]|uniref:hydantoinase B/oxoprolinase family protein n=1 Tax=unclassified Mesorhizobium TaxID=325217 RepID=UPI00333BCB61